MRVASIRAVILALAAGLWLGSQPSLAAASPHHPTGGYAPFGDCPLADPNLEFCLFGTVDDGMVAIGHRTVPVSAPVTLQGGFYEVSEETELAFVGAEDGSTLSSMPQSVPGGLPGLIPAGSLPASLRAQFSAAPTAVTMTLQLARPADEIWLSTENIIFERGLGLRMPLKIKLNNPFLGASCYIGSSSSPVLLSMTTGTTTPPAPNKPIKGSGGSFHFTGYRLSSGYGTVLVDNSFSVPLANGCGGVNASFIDRVLDATLGLPSPAGQNTAILDSALDSAASVVVRESE